MINTPQEQQNIQNTPTAPNKEEILNNLNKETKTFSRKIEFVGLDYKARREKVEDVTHEIIDFLYKEHFERRNVLMNLLKEIIKNSADHSGSDLQINIDLKKDISSKKIELRFSLYDEGPGIPYEEDNIKDFFDTGKSPPDREKKDKNNYGIGLGIIKAVAKTCTIDLILHNKGKIIHLHDLELQKEKKEKYIFGYEGVGIFDIAE